MASVAIARDDSIEIAIEQALAYIDMGPLVRHKVVAVKPNDTWATPEDTSGVTQGDTLRAVLRYVKRFGPRELVVTGGAGAAETADVFRYSGMMQALNEEGAVFFDHNRPPFVAVKLDYPADAEAQGPQREVMVNPRVLQYETLIALNQLKVHQTATVTLALKNIAMSYPAADYYGHPRMNEQHPHSFFEDLHSFIAVMAKRFPIDLAVTVGNPAMIGQGPLGGKAFDTGLVIASTDAVAADCAGAMMLGFQPQAVRHLWEAGRMGVGDTDMHRYEYPLLSLEEAHRHFTKAAYGEPLQFYG